MCLKPKPDQLTSINSKKRYGYFCGISNLFSKINDKREKELQFDWVERYVHEGKNLVPDYDKHESHVQMTTAAIIREEVLVQKQIEKEKQKIMELEVNMRDSTEFKRWQKRERKKDDINRIIHIHKKKVEMELAREAGI